ncbi:MAG: hypothetical protein ACXAC5_25505 [Promethearchaeota archaeon]|jgi:hypothetical protein
MANFTINPNFSQIFFKLTLGLLKYLAIAFVIDLALTILLKGIVLGKSPILITDFLMPGLLSGLFFRLLRIGFGIIFFFLYLLAAFVPYSGAGFEEAFAKVTEVLADVIALVFEDFVGFIVKYAFSFDVNIIVHPILDGIQQNTGIPVLDFYKGLADVSSTIMEVVNPTKSVLVTPLFIAQLITFFVVGGSTYLVAEVAAGAFADYSDS